MFDCKWGWVCAAWLFLPCVTSNGADGSMETAEILGRAIIDAKLPLEEVEAFTAARVPPMPEGESVDSPEKWQRYAAQLRAATLEQVVLRGRAARWHAAETRVEWLNDLDGGPGYRIRKLRYEALPGLWIPALLYVPDKLDGKVPVVMNVNGHDGNGKAAAYKQIRCINQAKRGMLALNVEWLGMGQLRSAGFVHYRMNQLDLCGTSGLAPFYLAMKRGLDVLLSLEHADPERVAVAGLSGGGWQTIFISALDERVTLSNPVAGYSSFLTRIKHHSDLGDSEQTPSDLATVVDYAHLTAMRAPRPTLLTFNSRDQCCFASGHALPPLLQAAEPVYEVFGQSNHLRWHVNDDPGTHNFEVDNRQALYKMFGDFFFSGDQQFDAREIASDGEVKTAEELHVELPSDNTNFHQLALALSRELPRPQANGTEARRKQLAEVVRLPQYAAKSEVTATVKVGAVSVRFLKFRVGETWTIPAVEFTPPQSIATAVVVADAGRASLASEVDRLLAEQRRVLAVDPFYFGESKINSRDFLFALLVSAVGERPLGLQSGQLAAVANWCGKEHPRQPVELHAHGPRTSLAALIAAAVDGETITALHLHDSFTSLKEILNRDLTVQQAPELFCFGLLEQFDIPQINQLVAPRKITVRQTEAAAP